MTEKILPSKFMRSLRPEYYSDTEDRTDYILDAPTFEYHLSTITQRNQTHDFELFVRKLCERAICPNLRPQTGPEGGGDGKVDSETYPVADEISDIYIGEANSGREKWAFAFSAQADWKRKVTKSVKDIVGTGRNYDRIICVSNQAIKQDIRLKCEQDLSSTYKVPVTIHDKSWIVKETIEHNRKDIAFNYLNVGQAKNDPLHLGPEDYSRTQQLKEIEELLDDPRAYPGKEAQMATEALLAAKLSRNSECARTETDGRFQRAIRLARASKSYRHEILAWYEHIWSAFWWFDDFQFVLGEYDEFEKLAMQSNHIANIELLCNLQSSLSLMVRYDHLSEQECRLEERTNRLMSKLIELANEKDRPNNSLEAEVSLLIVEMHRVSLTGNFEKLSEIWKQFSLILDRAAGLGEFDADRLSKMIESCGEVAGNSSEYSAFIEKLSEFITKRKGEGDGAAILVRRATKLGEKEALEAIRLLGRAAVKLVKREYNEQLLHASWYLAHAYRSIGLLWAARATIIFALAAIILEGEEDNQIPVSFVPAVKLFGLISFELGHIPDFLVSIHLLRGALLRFPLTEDSKAKVERDIEDMTYAIGSFFLNLKDDEIARLESLPDILEDYLIFNARSALLYTLGYLDELRKDGSIPASESDLDVEGIYAILASQLIGKQRWRGIITNDGAEVYATKILGMIVNIKVPTGKFLILAAEAIIGALEAFFATAMNLNVFPHLEKFDIELVEVDAGDMPSIKANSSSTGFVITWPKDYFPAKFDAQGQTVEFLISVCAHVLGYACHVNDPQTFLKQLFSDEGVQHRLVLISVAANSYHRLCNRNYSGLTDWKGEVKKTYPLRKPRPRLQKIDMKEGAANLDEREGEVKNAAKGFPTITNHEEVTVRSVIDVNLWKEAKWGGTGYVMGGGKPPTIVLVFKNQEPAGKIFERWRERFGDVDSNGEIQLSFIKDLPENPHHYIVMLYPRTFTDDVKKPEYVITKSMTMTPSDDVNLSAFEKEFKRWGRYYIVPGLNDGSGSLAYGAHLSILKTSVVFKSFNDVGPKDIESVSVGFHKQGLTNED